MNAREHFENTVVPNYNDFVQSPSDFRLLENALFSMNTVAERPALERREYGQVARGVLYGEAQKIRDDLSGLSHLQSCANTLKHVRSIKDQTRPVSPKAHAAAVATSPLRSVSNSISVASISPPARTQAHAAARTDGFACRRSGSATSG